MLATPLFSAEGVSVTDFRCDAGPDDTPFPELHTGFSISYVRRGSFGYRVRGGSFELVAGSVLVGHPGDEFVCTHEHHAFGDECLSFQLAPELVEGMGPTKIWRAGALPPLPELVVWGEAAQAAVDGRASIGLDEAGLLLAARLVEAVSGTDRSAPQPGTRERCRAVKAALWIDHHSHEVIGLGTVARHAGLSPFHFLRLFTRVVGLTPHQHLIRCRLRRAARLLAGDTLSITEVAAHAGFGDLSNFVRTFRRAARVSPREFRRTTKEHRKNLQERPVSSSLRRP